MLFFKAHHPETVDTAKPALVILHGMFGAGDNWLTIARELGAERRVYTIDLPGHGESAGAMGERPFFYPHLAECVAETLPALVGFQPVMLCGPSMGGKAAMALTLSRPELVAGLMVVDTAPVSYVGAGFNTEVLEMLAQVDPSGVRGRMDLEASMKQFLDDPIMRGFMLKSLVPLETGGYRWRFDQTAIVEGAEDIADWPEPSLPIKAFSGPVLFIKGQLSPYIQPERDLPNIVRLFPTAKLSEIAQARHWVHFDNKARFVSLVREFMG